MSTCILVTGVPYSGKSIPAGILHHLGVYMGEFEIKPDPIYNPNDYYEHPLFVNFHADTTGTRDIHGMIRAIHDLYYVGMCYSYTDKCKDLINNIFDTMYVGKEIWGLKDPRLCIPNMLDNFCSITNDRVDTIKLVICNRDFGEVLKCHIDAVKEFNVYTMAEMHNYITYWFDLSSKIYNAFGGEKMEVDFGEAVDTSMTFVNKIADFAGVPVTENAYLFANMRVRQLNEC